MPSASLIYIDGYPEYLDGFDQFSGDGWGTVIVQTVPPARGVQTVQAIKAAWADPALRERARQWVTAHQAKPGVREHTAAMHLPIAQTVEARARARFTLTSTWADPVKRAGILAKRFDFTYQSVRSAASKNGWITRRANAANRANK